MLSRRTLGGAVIAVVVIVIAIFIIWQASRISLDVSLARSTSQVAYVTFGDTPSSGADVYVLDADTGTITQLTANHRVRQAVWSAKGESLVLSLGEKKRLELLANGETQSLPDLEGYTPIFSPDQTHFAYDNCLADAGKYEWHESAEIVVGETNTTNTRVIKNACFPAWSPNGEQIAFTSQQSDDADPEIYIETLDGSEQHRLIANPGADVFAEWSPSVDQIAFRNITPNEKGYHETLYRMAGQNLTLIDDSYWANPVAWSPDGQTLLYVNLFNKMCFLKADATTPSCPVEKVGGAIWSTNGKQVAYTKLNDVMCIMDSQFFGEKRCFPGTEHATFLAWRPGP